MNVFAISYYAPPQMAAQAIQVGRLLYHLDAAVTLLHARGAPGDSGFDQYPDFGRRVEPLPVPDPGPRLTGRLQRAVRKLLPLYGACPDQFGPWRRQALPQALAHIERRRPDVLASFGMPMSGHLLALAIRRRTGLPWLAHFSDPWADNPFRDTGRVARLVNAAMERRVLAQADRILFTSGRTLELVMRKYPPSWRARAAVLPHAWDTDNFGAPLGPAAPPDATLAIRHIGNCYGARSPQPLFAALAHIALHRPRALEGVAFELVGRVSPALLDSPDLRALPPGLVRVRGPVSYRESLQLAQGSAALLVIDAPSRAGSVFLPSKLIEYIGARRPVWGITPPGEAADLIAQWAGGAHACADPADPGAVARMLLGGLASLRAAPPRSGPEPLAQRFAAPRVARALGLHLRAAAGRCPPQNRLNVLFVAGELQAGGAERHLVALAGGLARRGHRVAVACLKGEGGLAAELARAGVQRCPRLFSRGGLDLAALARLAALIRAERPALVVATSQYCLMYGVLARMLPDRGQPGGKPRLAFICHSMDIVRRGAAARLRFFVYRRFYPMADCVLFVSELQRRFFASLDVRARRAEVVHSGVDLAHFSARPFAAAAAVLRARYGVGRAELTVGACALFRAEKRHADLLEALALLRGRGLATRAVLIGDGPLRRGLEQCRDRLGLADRVLLAGLQSDVRPWIAMCDVMALTSDSETFPIVTLECMALGKPLVASDVGGVREQLTHGENALLYPAGDIDALADALARLADPALRARLGQGALDTVRRRFGQRRMVARYEALFAALGGAPAER